jgi:hemolysin activation/secretion protein
MKALGLKSNSYIYSLYYDQPLVRTRGFEFKTYAALNYKRARTWSKVDRQWEQAFGQRSPFADVDQVTSIDAGFNLRKDTKYGIWYFNQMASMAIPIFDSESSYFKYSGGLLRLHDFSHGFIGQLRGSYQVIPNSKHIPYIDLFQTGGLATVRGYSEGLLMGKNGYYVSGELMFPLLPRTITTKSGTHNFIGNYIKGAVFADTAGVFPWVGEDYMGNKTRFGMDHDGCYFLASIGMGLRVQLPGDLSARLYWGYPLINNEYEKHRHLGRFHFELTMEPNFDALLRKRVVETKPAPPKPAQPQPQPIQPVNNYDDIRHYDYFNDGSGGSL